MHRTAFKILNFNYSALKWLAVLFILPIFSRAPQYSVKIRPVEAAAIEFQQKLQADADALLPLFEQMPQVPVFVKDAPIIKTGSSIECGVAYTQCENPSNPVIFIKKAFYEKTNRRQLVNILKHELTHASLCRQNLMAGHDELFRQKFKAVGGFGN